MIYLLVWLVCGVIAAYLYQQKGRSSGLGFLGGFLLGPIGIILVLISSSTLAKCPYCAEEIKPIATVCKHCGRDLPENWSTDLVMKKTWVGPLIFGIILLLIL